MKKQQYLKWIKENSTKLKEFQSDNGCFFYPYIQGKTNYPNARFQEATLTLAWLYSKTKDINLKKRVEKGVDFWCKIQHKGGYFSENSKNEQSFSATAFTTFAIAKSLDYIPIKEQWLKSLKRAGDWLCSNNEYFFTNQQMAAALALIQLWKLTQNHKYLRAAQKKLTIVLNNQSKDGFFYEKQGLDLSYSSLTLDMLGNYYLIYKDPRILAAAEKYIEFAAHFIYPDGSFGGSYNTRKTGWLILNGFEVFSKDIPKAQYILDKLHKCHKNKIGNIFHLPDDRHLCTDLYRLCFAYDNCQKSTFKDNLDLNKEFLESNLKIVHKNNYIAITNLNQSELFSLWHTSGLKIFTKRKQKDSKYLDLFKPFGIHKFRKLKYLLPKFSSISRAKYIFLDNSIQVTVQSSTKFLIANNNLQITSKNARINTKTLGKISIEDSIFFGDYSLTYDLVVVNPLSKIASIEMNFK